ncbi:MAG: 3-phosphoglycerate dehydrogenase [Ruminococcaceae bacterium]|nr:3-phosphoglycerate dehydrogenase [Oscillospiraceae bacterium]
MKNIQLLNKIAKVGTDVLDKNEYNVGAEVQNPDAIMVRSAAMHDMEFGKELRAIARCGAGVNNIPVDRCSEDGIVVFNTPGANANGVKELAIAAILLAARDITGGIKWANSLKGTEGVAKAVEAGKSAFAGGEIAGKTLGVIGLGAIGGKVANAALDLGMNVVGCDPFLTIEAAWNMSRAVKKVASFEEVFKAADYVTLHVPATPQTKNMINAETLAMMKDGVKIINLSRADLVNAADMKAAIASGKVSKYVVDFPTEDTVDVDGIITIPHLGASTAESEDNCAVMAAHQLDDFLRNGNIKNSVNYPNVSLAHVPGCTRVGVFHKNIPAIITKISGAFAEAGVNIENFVNASKGDNAYTLIETATPISDDIAAKIANVESVVRVQII